MREIPRNIITKKSCDKSDKLCYHLKPYSFLDIAFDKKNTQKEKNEHLERYKNTCSNKDGMLFKNVVLKI